MKNKFTILIGDRNENIRDFLKRELMQEGYDIRLAKNGREILNMAKSHPPPDLIVMDIFVQIIDGLIVIEELRKGNSNIPIVVFTDLVEYKDDPIVKKADAFLEKEGQTDELIETVSKVLKKEKLEYEKPLASIA